jgi:hypothetical protein
MKTMATVLLSLSRKLFNSNRKSWSKVIERIDLGKMLPDGTIELPHIHFRG